MPRSNVDIVRSLSEPWKHGDFGSADWAHPDIEWIVADGPAPDARQGIDGMVEGWREVLSAWSDWRAEAEDMRELDRGRVIVDFRFSARGKASGFQLGGGWTDGALLYELRDGKVTKMILYWSRQRAYEELDLPEPP